MSEALRLAECIDFPSVHLGHEAATELRRLYDLHGKANALCRIRAERIKELEAELMEQARVNGMGSEREARLMAVNAELVEALKGLADEFVKTFPVYYASEPWRHETNAPLRKARAALAKAEASNGKEQEHE